MRATSLDPTHHHALEALLRRDEEANLYLLSLLSRQGVDGEGSWLGAIGDDGSLLAAVFLGAPPHGSTRASTAVPAGTAEACLPLGRACRREGGTCMIVGPRAASDALWVGLGYDPNRIRFNQRLYVCDRPPPGPTLPLRWAREDEALALAHMGAQMLAEDLGIDPRRIRPELHLERTRERAAERRILVAEQGPDLVFKIDLSETSAVGVQVGGTYVPHAWRGRGVATRAMRELCRLLLAQVPRITLHVNEANEPAVRCYESAGFRRAAAFRLISV